MNYIQETSSQIVYQLPQSHRFVWAIADETSGGVVNDDYLPWSVGTRVIESAWDLSFKTATKDLGLRVRETLSTIQNTLTALHKIGLDVSYFPQLNAFLVEDGSFLLEWTFSDYRVGFSVESNQIESSWFLVTNRHLGEISASGLLSGVALDKTVLWLLSFIFSHS